MNDHTITYLAEMREIIAQLDVTTIEKMADELVALRDRCGRLFIAGIGGSSANASHACNDFRRLCRINAVCLTDNVAELTAAINDDGWEKCMDGILSVHMPSSHDALLILSVGGGSPLVSAPLYNLIHMAETACGMQVLAIVGRDGGAAAKSEGLVVIVPTVEPARVTAHTEAFQGVILHALVSNPKLQVNRTKW